MKEFEHLSKSGKRRRLRQLAKEGRLMLVCPEPNCGQVVTELHKWSVRYWCCRNHIELFRQTGNSVSNKQMKRFYNGIVVYADTDNLRPRGMTTSVAAFTDMVARVEHWYMMYDLTVFRHARIYCLHCSREDVIGDLYRTYVGCRECVPNTGTGLHCTKFRRFVTRRQSVDDFIARHVMRDHLVSTCTNPEQVANRVRKEVYREWLAHFHQRYGKVRPCRFALWPLITDAWNQGYSAQDIQDFT